MDLTEATIMRIAANASAVSNGKKLSQKGSFSNLCKNAESTVYWADCKGSSSSYETSVDFGDGNQDPVCRCSCPSRQFPCKHGIGLMFEIIAGKTFSDSVIPEALAAKIAKREAAEAKKEAKVQDAIDNAGTPKAKSKSSAAASKKKMAQQLEGLDVAEKMVDELLSSGIATLSGQASKKFRDVANELGNYYIPGLQVAFLQIGDYIQKMKDADNEKTNLLYQKTIEKILRINTIIQKGRDYLQTNIEMENISEDNGYLFEALGGIWKFESLVGINSFEKDVQLIQLGLYSENDDVKLEHRDIALYVELKSGELFRSVNIRPYASNAVKEEDANFEKTSAAVMVKYPGIDCRRIRWEQPRTTPITADDCARILSVADPDITTAAKKVKNVIKNTMAENDCPVLFIIEKILVNKDNQMVVVDKSGNNIMLRGNIFYSAEEQIKDLPAKIKPGDAIFGEMYYKNGNIYLLPLSYINEEKIIRIV